MGCPTRGCCAAFSLVASLVLLVINTGAACGGGIAEPATDSGSRFTDAVSASTLSDAGGAAVIVNSGSTNAVGFSITVTPDGHASWHNNPPSFFSDAPNALGYTPMDGGTCADGSTVLDSALTAKLFRDLAAAGLLANLHFDNCPKSISFGTTTSLTYGGATVLDTECGSSTDARAAALSNDVVDVENAIAAACP